MPPTCRGPTLFVESKTTQMDWKMGVASTLEKANNHFYSTSDVIYRLGCLKQLGLLVGGGLFHTRVSTHIRGMTIGQGIMDQTCHIVVEAGFPCLQDQQGQGWS